MNETPTIIWNDQLKIAIADVDETIAEVYSPADPGMIEELSSFLREGGKLFMVTGGSLARIKRDITDKIEPELRRDILVAQCSGSEVWGFGQDGEVANEPFFSVYEDTFDSETKERWREVIAQLVEEFSLRTHPAQPKVEFWDQKGRDPLDIMLDDRGPQITMEVVNGTDLTEEQLAQLDYEVLPLHGKYDLRGAIKARAEQLLKEREVPITPRLAGNFALDFAVEGVSKTTSIKVVLGDNKVLETIGLTMGDVVDSGHLEVWGDKFSELDGGTDRHMSEALSPEVRSIDFREENPEEFPKGYNIVVWDGEKHLHHGLLEYLQSRHSS